MSFGSFIVRSEMRNDFEDITERVRRAVEQSGIRDGLCLVSVPHTTAAVMVNEAADPSVRKDILKKLSTLIPTDDGYDHIEGNSDAHIKAGLFGNSVTLPVSAGKLILGTWQGIFFCEFDGPRSRTVNVAVIG